MKKLNFKRIYADVSEQTYNELFARVNREKKPIDTIIDEIICKETKTPTKNRILSISIANQKNKIDENILKQYLESRTKKIED